MRNQRPAHRVISFKTVVVNDRVSDRSSDMINIRFSLEGGVRCSEGIHRTKVESPVAITEI